MKSGTTLPFLKSASPGENILLTGIPRSGTTLACRLLCEYSKTIALNEPLERNLFQNPAEAIKNIGEHFNLFRKSLLHNGSALARTKEGQITDNAFSPDEKNRERVVERSTITFDKKLDDDFTLILKHCAEFTLLLPEIKKSYKVIAVVRNPLAILSSWATVNVPVSRGKVSKSERLNPEFHKSLESQSTDLLQRQLFILSWYFGQYTNFIAEHIIRYEDLINNPEQALNPIAKGKLKNPFENLNNKNNNTLYNQTNIQETGEALLNSEGNYWHFYSKEEVISLMNNTIEP